MRMTENLSEKYIIGYGSSSTVYKCVLKNCKPVAIKRLYSHYPQCLKEFETELETVGSIKHRNLVCLQGYSLSPSGNLLFYDYMENGSLYDFLHGKFTYVLNHCFSEPILVQREAYYVLHILKVGDAYCFFIILCLVPLQHYV